MLADYRLFFKQFRRNFHATGAILPSGRALCKSLACYVRGTPGPNRILEVGPGTGVVTWHIIRAMGPDDRLDLVELNEQFVACLRRQFVDVDVRVALVIGIEINTIDGNGVTDPHIDTLARDILHDHKLSTLGAEQHRCDTR